MTDQPSVFIGSSTENLDYANALQSVLDHDLLTTVWTYGVFQPTGATLTSLIDLATRTDFAALFLTPDDKSRVRGHYLKTPRDNLVFELGLFIGALGPDRVFLLVPRDGVDLPSDLQGVTPIGYRADRPDQDLQNAVNPAATQIRIVAKRKGTREQAPAELVSPTRPPAPEVLLAISRLGSVVGVNGATLEIRSAGSRFEIVVRDDTHLGTSVAVDLSDAGAVAAIDHLCEMLQ